jgi:hypothetical protein
MPLHQYTSPLLNTFSGTYEAQVDLVSRSPGAHLFYLVLFQMLTGPTMLMIGVQLVELLFS